MSLHRRKGLIAALAAGASLAMLGFSFAAVPLYRLFCAATGFGGTPQIVQAAPGVRGLRHLTVRFDANVAPGLAWKFAAETPQIKLRTGDTVTVYYKATNLSDRETAGRAMFNVSPDSAGAYFSKVACFCFSEQRLGPGESRDMPVMFFLDPKLEKDAALAGVETITLSYTYFAHKPSSGENLADAQKQM
ncbi:MAG: cytochrome c oxidase assembly protein [Beijerinckiaceae bacterium]|nr:cytochrome c oxidase assembly protein [Beijerinckiaceae bacterium]